MVSQRLSQDDSVASCVTRPLQGRAATDDGRDVVVVDGEVGAGDRVLAGEVEGDAREIAATEPLDHRLLRTEVRELARNGTVDLEKEWRGPDICESYTALPAVTLEMSLPPPS